MQHAGIDYSHATLIDLRAETGHARSCEKRIRFNTYDTMTEGKVVRRIVAIVKADVEDELSILVIQTGHGNLRSTSVRRPA